MIIKEEAKATKGTFNWAKWNFSCGKLARALELTLRWEAWAWSWRWQNVNLGPDRVCSEPLVQKVEDYSSKVGNLWLLFFFICASLFITLNTEGCNVQAGELMLLFLDWVKRRGLQRVSMSDAPLIDIRRNLALRLWRQTLKKLLKKLTLFLHFFLPPGQPLRLWQLCWNRVSFFSFYSYRLSFLCCLPT